MTLEPHVVETLKSVSTATLTTVLLKKGFATPGCAARNH